MGIKTNRRLNPEQQAENLDRFQRNKNFQRLIDQLMLNASN